MKNYKLLFFAIFAFSLVYLIFVGIFFQFDLEDNSLWHYIGWSWTQSDDILLKQFAINLFVIENNNLDTLKAISNIDYIKSNSISKFTHLNKNKYIN